MQFFLSVCIPHKLTRRQEILTCPGDTDGRRLGFSCKAFSCKMAQTFDSVSAKHLSIVFCFPDCLRHAVWSVARDAAVVAIGDCLTSIFGGVVIFTIIGYMAHELGTEIENVATQGMGHSNIDTPNQIAPFFAVSYKLASDLRACRRLVLMQDWFPGFRGPSNEAGFR